MDLEDLFFPTTKTVAKTIATELVSVAPMSMPYSGVDFFKLYYPDAVVKAPTFAVINGHKICVDLDAFFNFK